MSPPADLDDLPASDLRTLVLQLLDEVSALKQLVAEQRAEIARLKGLKGPPSIKPSGMEQASSAKPGSGGVKRRGRGGKKLRREMIEDRVVAAEVPAGSRFKGYETYLIQDLVVRPVAIRFRRERWLTPDGRTIVAPLPAGTAGHFVRRGAPNQRGGRSLGLELLVSRRPMFRRIAPVGANGVSQVSWRSIPCLCPAPRPRPSRRDLAFGGLLGAAPGSNTPKASAGT